MTIYVPQEVIHLAIFLSGFAAGVFATFALGLHFSRRASKGGGRP